MPLAEGEEPAQSPILPPVDVPAPGRTSTTGAGSPPAHGAVPGPVTAPRPSPRRARISPVLAAAIAFVAFGLVAAYLASFAR